MKSYILDTHTLIWFCEGNEKLSKKSKSIIENKENLLFVSFASLWEIVIKLSLGKLKTKINFNILVKFIEDNDISILNSNINHLKTLEKLPFHHDDPFDKFIIAQAIHESTLKTKFLVIRVISDIVNILLLIQ